MVRLRNRRRVAGLATLAALAMAALPASPAFAAWCNPYAGGPVLRTTVITTTAPSSPDGAGRQGMPGDRAERGNPAGQGAGTLAGFRSTGDRPVVLGWNVQWQLQRVQERRVVPAAGHHGVVVTERGNTTGSPSRARQGGEDGSAGPAQKPPTGTGDRVASPSTRPAPSPGTVSGSLTAQERRLVDLVNAERRNRGLAELAVDPDLTRLARLKARDMQEKGYFSHSSPTYGSPYEMELQAGIRARVMGAENLAQARDVEYAHRLLMGSQGHRANLLNPAHDRIGVAVVPARYGVLVVQLFLGGRYQ